MFTVTVINCLKLILTADKIQRERGKRKRGKRKRGKEGQGRTRKDKVCVVCVS